MEIFNASDMYKLLVPYFKCALMSIGPYIQKFTSFRILDL